MRRRALGLCLLVAALSCDKSTAPARGDLSLFVGGLPAGTAWRVVLTGPGMAHIEVTGSGTLADLPTGNYSVHADPVVLLPDTVVAPADTTIRIVANKQKQLSFSYRYVTGGLELTPQGHPAGDTLRVTIRSPTGIDRTVTIPANVRGLMPGTWTVVSNTHETRVGDRYSYGAGAGMVVTAGPMSTPVTMAYSLASGAIAFDFVGLPTGLHPNGYYIGADAVEHPVTSDSLVRGLTPGWYYAGYKHAYGRAFSYEGEHQELVQVSNVPQPQVLHGTYALNSGAFRLAVTGADSSAVPVISIRRVGEPGDQIRRTVTGDTIPWIAPGTYEVVSLLFSSNGTNYQTKTPDTVTVALGEVADATLELEPRTAPFDARLDFVNVTQAIQNLARTVPLVAGREALARVYVFASEENVIVPELRLRVKDGAATILDTLVTSGTWGIPTSTERSDPYVLFAIRIPGAAVRPSMVVEADLNPRDLYDDAVANDHLTFAPIVNDVPPMQVRLVPVSFLGDGGSPNLTPANAAAWLEETGRLHPLGDFTFDLREPYVTSRLRPTQLNPNPWIDLLSDLEAIRIIEGGGTRHYAGVLHVNYFEGVAGIGIIGGRSALVWDDLSSGNGILAHELGHNFGRYHAPCGNPAGVDPAYPRAIAQIGDWGWDPRTNVPVSPGDYDLMSYCLPAWTSAYTWKGVMDARAAAASAYTESGEQGRMLLISGTIANGVVSLDPAFAVDASSRLPRGGPHRLVLRDSTGAQILATAFASEPLSEPAVGVEQFMLSIPERMLGGRSPASLVVEAAGRSVELRSTGTALTTGAVEATRRADGHVDLRWTGAAARGFIVRDATTGQVVTISRESRTTVPALPAGYDVIISDGLRSTTQRVRPANR